MIIHYTVYIPERSPHFLAPDSQLKIGGAAIFPGADCHQSSTIPPWPMCVTIQGQTATSHQPFHPGLCVSLSRGRLPPVINHSTLAYVCHYPGSDCHQSSTIPPWPMCATIQVQTATSHQPFHPGLCVSLSRCRLPPVINHSTLAYVCHYPGADCHQSSTIPPWPMCVTIQVQTATSHQPFHPGLCVSLSRDRLPPVINHSTLAYVCHYPGADCHQSSTIPPWPMCVTIQGQTATSHQPFHPGLCVSLSRGRLPPVINHSTLTYVCHYPGADCHQSSTIPPWPMCVTIQGPSEVDSTIFEKGGPWGETMSKSITKASTLPSHCLSRLGGNRCDRVHHRPIYNLLSRQLTPSHHRFHWTILVFAFVTLCWSSVKLGLHQGTSVGVTSGCSATARGVFPHFDGQPPPSCYLSDAAIFPVYTVIEKKTSMFFHGWLGVSLLIRETGGRITPKARALSMSLTAYSEYTDMYRREISVRFKFAMVSYSTVYSKHTCQVYRFWW